MKFRQSNTTLPWPFLPRLFFDYTNTFTIDTGIRSCSKIGACLNAYFSIHLCRPGYCICVLPRCLRCSPFHRTAGPGWCSFAFSTALLHHTTSSTCSKEPKQSNHHWLLEEFMKTRLSSKNTTRIVYLRGCSKIGHRAEWPFEWLTSRRACWLGSATVGLIPALATFFFFSEFSLLLLFLSSPSKPIFLHSKEPENI